VTADRLEPLLATDCGTVDDGDVVAVALALVPVPVVTEVIEVDPDATVPVAAAAVAALPCELAARNAVIATSAEAATPPATLRALAAGCRR